MDRGDGNVPAFWKSSRRATTRCQAEVLCISSSRQRRYPPSKPHLSYGIANQDRFYIPQRFIPTSLASRRGYARSKGSKDEGTSGKGAIKSARRSYKCFDDGWSSG